MSLAKRTNTADVWNAAGLGFHLAAMHDEATRIFDGLVRAYPGNDHYRLNLATSLSQTSQIEQCCLHLRHVAEQGSTEVIRKERSACYAATRISSAYPTAAGGSGRSRSRASGGRFRGPAGRPSRSSAWPACCTRKDSSTRRRKPIRTRRTCSNKGAAFPDDPRLLEMLIACYLRYDPNRRLGVATAELERIAPHSPVLQLIGNIDDDEARAFEERNAQRASKLMAAVCEPQNSQAVRDAALRDLSAIVAMYPENPNYRTTYAFALMGVGRYDDALAEARKLNNLPLESHTFHFNLGQVFWISGDSVRGRRHLELALEYASDDQERKDVRDRIADLERTRP